MDQPTPAQAAEITPAPAAAPTGADTAIPQSVLENMSLEQMNTLFETGNVELPAAGGEGVTVQEVTPPAAKVEPAPGVTLAVVEPTPVVTESVVEVVETRSAEQIQADQATAVEAVKAAGGDEVAQLAAAEAAAQPVAAVEPVVEPAAPAKDDNELPERFRVKDPFARAALAIYKAAEAAGVPITLAEAEARARGPEVKPAPVVPVVLRSVKIAETVTALETEVAALETQIEDGSDEVLPTRELAKLNLAHSRKAAELATAKASLDAARQGETQAIRAQSEAARATSTAEATADWPAAADSNSDLGKAIAADIAALEDPNHPDHSILWADSAPYVLTARNARKLGIPPAAKKAATPPPAKPIVAPPRKTVAPVSAVKTAVPAVTQPAEDAKATIDKARAGQLSVEEMDAMQGAEGGLSALLAGAAR